MWFLRTIIMIALGLLLAIVHISILRVLPFPFFLLPLFPIVLAVALVNRSRPSIFWLLFVAVAVSDIYRSGMFGVGIITLCLVMFVGVRVSSDLVTHRSIFGCLVISGLVGALWAATSELLIMAVEWFRFGAVIDGFSSIAITMGLQTLACAVVSAICFFIMPRWLVDRSPIIVRTPHI